MFPKRLDRKKIYESRWINLYVDKVLMPSGKIIEEYHQLDYQNDAVVVLLTNSEGKVCLIKSIRYTTQKIELELPAGGIEKGEDILKAAEREVLEETGLKTKSLKFQYSFNPANGMSNQTVHIVFGEVEDRKQATFDTDEVKEVYWLSSSEAKDLIKKNEIHDGISLMALLLFFSGVETLNP